MSRSSLFGGFLVLSALAGCGGGGTTSGAALEVSIHPADTRTVNARRLEELAAQFEAVYTCTPQDTIAIHGVASGTYSVEGCGHLSVYQQSCQMVGTSYARHARCQWAPIADDLMTRAASDFHCQPDTMDAQPAPAGQMGRVVMGCGYSATYVLQCQGVCVWALSGQIAQIGPVTQTAEPVNGAVSNGYITQ